MQSIGESNRWQARNERESYYARREYVGERTMRKGNGQEETRQLREMKQPATKG